MRRGRDVLRDLAGCAKEFADLLTEMASLVEERRHDPAVRGKGATRRAPTIVRPPGEGDDLTRHRANQIIRRQGLVKS
jgi:hypothetical protein